MNSGLNNEIIKLMSANGADIVGFADLNGVAGADEPYGIIVAIALPPHIFLSAAAVPNPEYYDVYNNVNNKLDNLATIGANFLREKGYNAKALTRETVAATENKRAKLPVKTVATRAGIGWIGKNGLLTTKRYGSALRMSSFVTDANVDCGVPEESTLCGECMMCRDNCPASAIAGVLWTPDTDRDNIVDVHKCAAAAQKLCKERIGVSHEICGKCIAVCPFTQKYAT